MNLEDFKPKQRFSTKAKFYENRADYPQKVIEILNSEINFSKDYIVADIGAGTGKLTRLFIAQGNLVFAIEPNREMMKLAVLSLRTNLNFQPISACAEQTGLADESVDLICIGQALHWFDKENSKPEFKRILKKPGYLAVLGKKYHYLEQQLEKEYSRIFNELCPRPDKRPNYDNHDIAELFSPYKPKIIETSEIIQQTPLTIIKGTLSYSYSPEADCPGGLRLIEELEKCLAKYASNGYIEMEIITKVTVGQMK